jgi:hypothetical protein
MQAVNSRITRASAASFDGAKQVNRNLGRFMPESSTGRVQEWNQSFSFFECDEEDK